MNKGLQARQTFCKGGIIPTLISLVQKATEIIQRFALLMYVIENLEKKVTNNLTLKKKPIF